MQVKKGHSYKLGLCALVLEWLILCTSFVTVALAAPATTILDGTGGGTTSGPKSDALLRSPEGMEAPLGCYVGGEFFDFGALCYPTERVSDCWSTQYSCKSTAKCTADAIFKAAGGSCTDPSGGLRSTCCDPAASCDGTGHCIQGPAKTCPSPDPVICKGYRCNCRDPGTCEEYPLNPLTCRPAINTCYCVYGATSTSSSAGVTECTNRCGSIGASGSYYDASGYCVCTASSRGDCPNVAAGQPLDTTRTYPPTCSILSISWAAPPAITYGNGIPAAHLNAVVSPTGVSGTMKYTYNGVEITAGHQLPAGDHVLVATFTPSDSKNFRPLSASVTQRVLKRKISFTLPALTKTYGDANPALTFTHTADFVLGDTFQSIFGTLAPATTATQTSVVNTYPITMTFPSVANYEPAVVSGGTLTILPKALTCQATSKRVPVGTDVTALGLDYTCSTFVGSDSKSIFSTTPTLSAVNYDKMKAGNYTIAFTRSPAHPNYTVTVQSGVLSVYADCVVSAWSVPSNPACGTTYLATRTITTQPANGGAACPYLSETRTAPACCGTSLATKSISCWYRTGTGSDCTCQPTAASLPSPYSTLLTSIANANPGFLGCNVGYSAGDSLAGRSGSYDGRLTYLGYQDAGTVVGGNPLTQASYLYILDAVDVSSCAKDCIQGPWYDYPAGQPTCGVAKTQKRDTLQQPAYGGVACGPSTQSVPQSACGITVSWNAPASIVYGTALSAAQLNATATFNGTTVAGKFTYNPPIGTVLGAGPTNKLTVSFDPTDTTKYSKPADVSVNQVVTKRPLECSAPALTMKAGAAVPTMTIACQNGFATGESIANLTVAGALTINSADTTKGADYPITFSTKPDSSNYAITTKDGTLKVYSDCVLGDYAPKNACTCGGADYIQTQTIVSPAVNGGTCNPASRTITCPRCAKNYSRPVGRATLASLFGVGANDSVGILLRHDNLTEVCKNALGANRWDAVSYANYMYMRFDSPGNNYFCGYATLRSTDITFSNKVCGGADGSYGYLSQLDCYCNCASATVCGNGKYEPGNNEECDGAAFPAGVPATTGCTANCKLFSKSTPVISWANPAEIIYGTALSGVQQNARALFSGANVAGTFTYAPVAGTILPVGRSTLTANFAPTDTTKYNSAVPVTVEQVVVKKNIPCVIASASRVYGEATNPTPSFTCSGFVGTDTQASVFGARVPTTTATQTSAAGSAQVYTLDLPTSDKYAFTVTGGALTITPRPLRVIPDNKSKAYGAANPALTHSYTGFVNGDSETQAGTLTTTAGVNSPIGSYAISFSTRPTVSGNYTLDVAQGVLMVGGSVVNCTVAAATRIYGDANPKFTFSCSGFLDGDTQASVFGTTAPTTTAVSSSAVGSSYNLTLAPPQSTKYAFNITNAKLTITPAELKCSGVGFSRVYGEANKTITTTCTGYKLSDGPSVLTSQGTFKGVPATSADVGTYTVNYDVEPTATSNYTVTATGATVTITKKVVTCTADNKTMTVNTTIPALTHTCTGLVLGQSQTIFGDPPPLEVDGLTNIAGAPKIKYTTTITHKNYEVTQMPGVMTVTGKIATSCTWADPPALTYGTGLAAATFTTNGAKEASVTPVAGSFTYSHKAGDVLNAGTTTMTATFTPTDTVKYAGCTCTAKQVVNASTAISCSGSVATRFYGDDNPVFTTTCKDSSGANAMSLITNSASIAFNAAPARNSAVQATPYEVGYATAPSAGPNYAIAVTPAKLTVQPRPLTCAPENKDMAIGTTVPALTAKCTGFSTALTESITSLTSQGTLEVVGSPSTATQGGTYVIQYKAAPSSANYAITVATGTLTVNQLKINWSPAPLEVHNAIGAPQFNATNSAGILGAYTYSKPSGSYSVAADYPETVTFVPTSDADKVKYGASIKGTGTIKVYKNCVLGSYPTPACGTGTQTVTQTVTEAAINGGTCSPGTQTVTAPKCTTSCTWTTPPALTYGTGLPAATFTTNGAKEAAGVAGTFSYSHKAGDIVGAGTTAMTATFVPSDTTKYSGCTVSVNQVVNKANTSCTIANASAWVGDTLGTGLISAQSSTLGSFTYTYMMGTQTLTAGTALSSAGTVTVTATFSPGDSANYNSSTCAGTLSVATKQQATCTLSPLTLRTDQSVTQSALEAKSTGSTGSQTISGTWSYKYRSTGAPVVMGTTLAKGSYLIDATWTLPANSGWSSATCSGTIYVGACTPSTQATDCNDNNSCTTDTCSIAGVCRNSYLGSQGSLNPTMTLTCPNTVTVTWNDTLKCVNPTESPTYAIGLDSFQAISLPNNPGNLVAMDKTKFAPTTVCANGICSKAFTVSSTTLEKTKTVYGGVATLIMGAQDKLSNTTASVACKKDCVVSGWTGPPNPCNGTYISSPIITQQPAFGGVACPQPKTEQCPPAATGCGSTLAGKPNLQVLSVSVTGDCVNNPCDAATQQLRQQVATYESQGYASVYEQAMPVETGEVCPAPFKMNVARTICNATACVYKEQGAPPSGNLCGNGVLDAGEQCDIGSGGSAGCVPGAKCVNCQLDYSSGGCRTLVGLRCGARDSSGNVKCDITTAWGPSAIATDISGTTTDCSDSNCCPPAGSDGPVSSTMSFGYWKCMRFSSLCPNNKGRLTDPDGFKFSHSQTTLWNDATSQYETGVKYTCVTPGDAGCDCANSVGVAGCP